MKPTRYGVPLLLHDDRPLWEEEVRRLTWREALNILAGLVVVVAAILGLVLLLSLGAPA